MTRAAPHPRQIEWEGVLAQAIDQARKRRLASMARDDFYVALAWDLPKPAEVAFYLELDLCDGLTTAWLTSSGMRVAEHHVAALQTRGLVGCGGPYLTAFGLAVRRVLLAEDE